MRWLLPLSLLALVIGMSGCGTGAERAANVTLKQEDMVIGSDVHLPLVLDGDRLGVSLLDGNAPSEILGPGSYGSVQYDSQGRLIYVQKGGAAPGFYRVEDGQAERVISMPLQDPWLQAKWSPDGSRGAWIEEQGATKVLRIAEPGGQPRTVGPEGIDGFLWPPDGKSLLAYNSETGTTYLISAETSDTMEAGVAVPKTWSAGGDFLVLDPSSPPGPGHVILVKQAGADRRDLGEVGLVYEGPGATFAFSSDGNRLAWDRASTADLPAAGLLVASVDGSNTIAAVCIEGCALGSQPSHPAWSPDGSQLAWSQDGHIVVAETGIWQGQIIADGTSPRWSPDGSEIAYFRTENQNIGLYVRASDGSGDEVKVVDLQDDREIDDQMAWSPDASRLVVPLQVEEKKQVYSFEPETGEVQALPVPTSDFPSALSPDGSEIVFAEAGDWLLVNLDGTQHTFDRASAGAICSDWARDGMGTLCVGSEGLKTLNTETGEVKTLLEGNFQDALWSPDGTRAAFIEDQQLGVLDLATGQVKMIAPGLIAMDMPNFYGVGYLAWSPDSERIAFGDWHSENPTTSGSADLYVVDADGANLQRLTDSPGAKLNYAFSPDGKYVAYVHSRADGDHIEIVDPDTGVEQPGQAPSFKEPFWTSAEGVLVDNYLGIGVLGVDGSFQLLVAGTGGCQQNLIGWANGKMVFAESCSHMGL